MRRQTLKAQARIAAEGPWRASIDGPRLVTLCRTRSFHRIVALMRVVNQMRFVFRAFLDSRREGAITPSDLRQTYHSYFFTCALFFEGYPLAQRLAQDYRDRESFKKGFAKLLADDRVKRFMADSLNALRNRAIFHPDEKEIGKYLVGATGKSLVVMSGVGDTAGGTYYNLCDMIAFQTLIGPQGTRRERANRARRTFNRVRSMMLRFVNSADRLIADVLREAEPYVRRARLRKPRKRKPR